MLVDMHFKITLLNLFLSQKIERRSDFCCSRLLSLPLAHVFAVLIVQIISRGNEEMSFTLVVVAVVL